jgi:hypothetical protein
MRRRHSEVTDPQEIERVLRTATIGRMASTGKDGYPYITPVNFVYHQGNIYFHCAPVGEKLDNIARDPLFHCVIIRGEASVVPDSPLKLEVLNALVAKHEPGIALQQVTEDLPPYRACAVIEIRPRTISAKSDLNQNKTPEERLAQARYLNKRNNPGDLETVRAMGFDPDAL